MKSATKKRDFLISAIISSSILMTSPFLSIRHRLESSLNDCWLDSVLIDYCHVFIEPHCDKRLHGIGVGLEFGNSAIAVDRDSVTIVADITKPSSVYQIISEYWTST